MTAFHYLAVATVACGAAVLLFGLWLVPAAIATEPLHGHRAERRRRALAAHGLFRAVEPALRVLAHHLRRARIERWRRTVAARLVQAGEPLGLSVDEFLGLTVIVALAGAAVGLLAARDLGLSVVLLLALLGAYYPNMWLADAARARLARIAKGLPYANDLLVLAMQAGLDLVAAVRQYVGKLDDPRDPIAQEFARILADLELGATRRAALEAFAERAPTEAVRGFVVAVVQAEQRGTPLADALKIQAVALRTHRTLLVEKLANRAGVLILLPLLLLFAATILTLFGGIIVRAVRGELM